MKLSDSGTYNTVTNLTAPANTLNFSAREIGYVFGGVGADSLYTLNQNSAFNIDGVIVDTDPLFTTLNRPTMVAATDRNTYTALVENYVLEFANFERIYAGTQTDTITLVEAVQRYIIRGGAGDDRLIFNNGAQLGGAAINGQPISFDGQGGSDTLDYSPYTTAIAVNLSIGQATAVNGAAINSVINIENVTGGSGNDTLLGDQGNNVLARLELRRQRHLDRIRRR